MQKGRHPVNLLYQNTKHDILIVIQSRPTFFLGGKMLTQQPHIMEGSTNTGQTRPAIISPAPGIESLNS